MMAMMVLSVVAGLLAAVTGHPWGIAPIAAAVVCAASVLRRREVWLVALGAMFLHDAILGFSSFTLVRLLAIAAVAGVVQWLRLMPRLMAVSVGVFVAAPLYQVILAVGDWATHYCTPHPRTTEGLFATLSSAAPYMQRSLLSDLAFTTMFLALYTAIGFLLQRRWPRLLAISRS